MAEYPAMPLWTDAYLADTTHLTTLEHGAYMLLLMAMWRSSEKALPNDDRKLARYSHLTLGQWMRIKPTLMEFFTVDGGQIMQGRLTDEANAVRQHSHKQSDKAKARWLKSKKTIDAAAMPEPCRSDASLTLTLPNRDSSLRSESCASRREFDEIFWPAYPNKKAKPKAVAAFKSARRKHSLETIMAGLGRYKANKPSDWRWQLPTTFLNQERFNDEYNELPIAPRLNGNGHARPSVVQAGANVAARFRQLDAGRQDRRGYDPPEAGDADS